MRRRRRALDALVVALAGSGAFLAGLFLLVVGLRALEAAFGPWLLWAAAISLLFGAGLGIIDYVMDKK